MKHSSRIQTLMTAFDDDFDGLSFFDADKTRMNPTTTMSLVSLDSVSLDESSDNSTATPESSSDEENLSMMNRSNDSDDVSVHQNSTFRCRSLTVSSPFLNCLLSLQ